MRKSFSFKNLLLGLFVSLSLTSCLKTEDQKFQIGGVAYLEQKFSEQGPVSFRPYISIVATKEIASKQIASELGGQLPTIDLSSTSFRTSPNLAFDTELPKMKYTVKVVSKEDESDNVTIDYSKVASTDPLKKMVIKNEGKVDYIANRFSFEIEALENVSLYYLRVETTKGYQVLVLLPDTKITSFNLQDKNIILKEQEFYKVAICAMNKSGNILLVGKEFSIQCGVDGIIE